MVVEGKMAERLKDSYGPSVALWVGSRLADVLPDLDAEAFAAECLPGYEDLELLDRARRMAEVMARHLPADPTTAVPLITAALGPVEEGLTGMQPFRYMPFVFYVGQHGLGAFEESMLAQYELTKRFTAEFSIRPFLIHHEAATLARLREWTGDPDPNVRRLVSEGTRPRLPWAPRLPAFVADPAPVLELLELLRDDPSEYVRRSVANNLNDISKDHPDVVVDVAGRWWADGDEQRRRLVRHALRTLVKRGDPTALEVLGHVGADHLVVHEVSIDPTDPVIGGGVRITATVVDTRSSSEQATAASDAAVASDAAGAGGVADAGAGARSGGGPAAGAATAARSAARSGTAGGGAPGSADSADPHPHGSLVGADPRSATQEVAVDLVVHFVKANGSTAPRVFKGAVRTLGPGGSTVVTRLISLAQQSTRTHHPGVHRVQVQVNGVRSDAGSFHLSRPG
jgi:3-methyladenine DNA glycosylase AlkC